MRVVLSAQAVTVKRPASERAKEILIRFILLPRLMGPFGACILIAAQGVLSHITGVYGGFPRNKLPGTRTAQAASRRAASQARMARLTGRPQ